jgi:hypothetical protein
MSGADEVNTPTTPSRLLLIGLTVWGLVMIVPDLVRVLQPLGSLGFLADNDGLIYDIDGPFPDEASSPAWRAGIRDGDQLDLDAMRCKFGKLATRWPCSAAWITCCPATRSPSTLPRAMAGRRGRLL